MDIEGVQFLAVIDPDNNIIGVFTSGDFRNAVLAGVDIAQDVSCITNKKFHYLNTGYSNEDAIKLFNKDMVNDLPVLDNGKLIDIVHKKDFIGNESSFQTDKIRNSSVVIMAGGKGTRLDPFTRILPKPLIPLGDEPIIKVIMDEFAKYGINKFYISLHDKAQMIKAYFHDHELPYKIEYIEETKPMGTAGGLRYLLGELSETFFVTNCDIIIKNDYLELIKYHQSKQYALTLVGSMKQYTIPYGICDIQSNGNLISIREKPDYDFLVNTGLYLLEPHVLEMIPENTCFDMTDLINALKINNHKIGVFPVSEKSWIDVGQWGEYKNLIKNIEFN